MCRSPSSRSDVLTRPADEKEGLLNGRKGNEEDRLSLQPEP